MQSDIELLDAWTRGDRKAGAALFNRYYPAVYRFFHAKGTRDIEDLVQETFVALVKGREAFREDATFRAYVFGTARNVLRHYFRRHGRKEGKLDLGSRSVVDLGPGPSTIVADRAEKRLLLEGLRRLAVDDQIIIELTLWERMTAVELGAVLGLSEPAVRSRLHRAKGRLRELLAELAETAPLLESTMSDLEGWAAAVREQLGSDGDPST